jgi:uncharacterized protein (DUF1800 family)
MNGFRSPLATLLCFTVLSPVGPVLSQTPSANVPKRQPYQPGQLQGDQRILHALTRFTFGPRSGDLEAVKSMGLENWFNQQLHPQTIDDSGLLARLDQFPAMQQDPATLLYRLPSGAVIRQAADGKAPIPDSGLLHKVYENEIARYQVRQQEKEKKQELASATTPMSADAKPIADTKPTASDPATATGPTMAAPSSTSQPPFDPSEITRILSLPPQQRVFRLAMLSQPEFDSFRKALKPPQRAALTAGLTPEQAEMVSALENPQRVVVEELQAQRLICDIDSNAQLQQVMTDFWLNHFNVFLHKNEETPYYLVSYERDVIRPLALGKFEDLLEATAHSPALLLYLDNSSSMGPDSPAAERAKIAAARHPGTQKKAPDGLNENYARELMELHTLGVNGGYTQKDVTEVARVLTGWTVDRPQRGGGFKFDENRHEPGTKKVLGKKIKEHGELEGRELLHMLASSPATAHFLCTKLAVRFVGDEPPQPLVDRLAKAYMKSGGDVSVVLTTLFHSPEFWSAEAYRAKVKTPLEYVVSAARASDASLDNMQPFVNALREMGMPLYGAVPPTGYNWQASQWVSTGALVSRMNFALSLAANRLPGITVGFATPLDAATTPDQPSLAPAFDSAQEEQRLETQLVAGGVNDTTRTALVQQFEAQRAAQTPGTAQRAAAKPQNPAQAVTAREKQDELLAGLLLGSPEFQRR